jgi:curli production assembly/transport component CsgG
MNKFIRTTLLIVLVISLSGCGAYWNQPTGPQQARISEVTEATRDLRALPPPTERIAVGVYNFRDQTGQYKNLENISSFSTAVTQGATTILIKALEDSKWFRPIERENINNLVNERTIIETTRQQYADPNNPPQRLSPLLFAGILLEGGVISYDTNILTGGVGARYFGMGGSSEYRQDRITIYLRAVSTGTGEVLKTVNVSKTILSQAVDVGLFRFVNFERLLEVETGFTKNEPTQLAVQAAIEKAVETLILEGIKDELWGTAAGPEKDKELVDKYVAELQEEEQTSLYERKYTEQSFRNVVNANLGMTLVDGDFKTNILDFRAGVQYRYRILPEFSLGTDLQIFRLNSAPEESFRTWWVSQTLLMQFDILPYDRLSPFIYGGPGLLIYADDTDTPILRKWDAFFQLKAGVGLEFKLSERISMSAFGDWNFTYTDLLDNVAQGVRDDFYVNFGLGVNYNFGGSKKRSTNENTQQ